MDKTQADAVAQAILEPDLRAQDEIQVKRVAKAAQLKRQRRIVLFALVGCGIGATVAYLAGQRFTAGVVWGGLAGSALGWLITRRAAA